MALAIATVPALWSARGRALNFGSMAIRSDRKIGTGSIIRLEDFRNQRLELSASCYTWEVVAKPKNGAGLTPPTLLPRLLIG